MLNSMTGYASQSGTAAQGGARMAWDWELRAVNGRGLDIRLRLPEGFGFMEKPLRNAVAAQVARGTVTVALRLRSERADGPASIDPNALWDLFQTLVQIEQQAGQAGGALRAPSTLDVLTWRGLHPHGHDVATFDNADLGARLMADVASLLAEFGRARASEGAALGRILTEQLAQIETLVAQARASVPDRAAAMRAAFRTILAQSLDAPQVDPVRLEQELAVQAVKTDLMEELDRLDAHCVAAHALLAKGGPVGRRLDFLTQEFNREANTLCAKAQHLELTRLGLELKSVIDQMREQVQNLE